MARPSLCLPALIVLVSQTPVQAGTISDSCSFKNVSDHDLHVRLPLCAENKGAYVVVTLDSDPVGASTLDPAGDNGFTLRAGDCAWLTVVSPDGEPLTPKLLSVWRGTYYLGFLAIRIEPGGRTSITLVPFKPQRPFA